MPQNLEFELPWEFRSSPHVDAAREHSIKWMRDFGILDGSNFTPEHFGDWRLAELAANFYPEATREGLELGSDLMGWYFAPFDDQFDGPLGRDPDRVASICGHMIDILDHPPAELPRGDFPTARAFADLWSRSCVGMSEKWRIRAAYSWKQYLTTQVLESINRKYQRVLDASSYIWQGRTVVSAHVVNDLRERVSGFEIPDIAWYSQPFTEMRDLSAEFVLTDNDLYSLEKEDDAKDEVNNLILILERTKGLKRSEAIARILDLTLERVHRFGELEKQVPELCEIFGQGDRLAIQRGVSGLRDIMSGSYEWGRSSGRYVLQSEFSPAQLHNTERAAIWAPLESDVR